MSIDGPQKVIPYTAEVYRKALHILALIAPLLMFVFGKWWSVYILLPLVITSITMDMLRAYSPTVATWVHRTFGFMMRQREIPSPGEPAVLNGATWILFSFLLLVLVFPVRLAATVLIACVLSDAAAALVGRRYGRHTWKNSCRTVEGSLAFLVTGLLIMGMMKPAPLWACAICVFAAALAEIPEKPLNDNLRVPVVAATVLYLLEYLVLGMDVNLF